MSIETEFPDYPKEDLPPIPETWIDVSWHNDSCPSWQIGPYIIFIDYKDPDERESGEKATRYFVMTDRSKRSDRGDILQTNNWETVLGFIKERTT